MKTENKMGTMPVPKLVITMALPLMLSLLVQSLYNIVDGIFVGMISEEAFTATSLAYPVQLLMVAVSVGTGIGVNAACSRFLGAGKPKDASRIAVTGLMLSLLCTAAFMIFGAAFLPLYTRACSGSAASVQMCKSYLRICTLFSLGIFMETLGQRLLQAVGNTLLSMVSLVCGALTNIILDPIFIFVFGLGIEGAAIATVIGQWVGAAIAFLLNVKTNREIRLSLKDFSFRWESVWQIYKVGGPTILTQAMGSVMMFSMNGILGILLPESLNGIFSATPAIAFFGAYYKLQNFLYMPIAGLGQAAIPIVAYNFGAGKTGRIKEVLRSCIPAAAGYAVLGTFIFELFPKTLLGIFSASDAAMAIGVPGLRIIAVTFVFGALTTVLGYVCSGLGNGMVNMFATILRQFIPLVPAAYLLGRFIGINSIWYAFWISEMIAAGFAVFCTKWEFRKFSSNLKLYLIIK